MLGTPSTTEQWCFPLWDYGSHSDGLIFLSTDLRGDENLSSPRQYFNPHLGTLEQPGMKGMSCTSVGAPSVDVKDLHLGPCSIRWSERNSKHLCSTFRVQAVNMLHPVVILTTL